MDRSYGDFLRYLRGYGDELNTEQIVELRNILAELYCNRLNGTVQTASHVKIIDDFLRDEEGRFKRIGTETQIVRPHYEEMIEELLNLADNNIIPLRPSGMDIPEWPEDSTFGRDDQHKELLWWWK